MLPVFLRAWQFSLFHSLSFLTHKMSCLTRGLS